jgi:cytoskeletal protein RodZ
VREAPLPSFGEKLKLEREKRKITLDQISSSTKISTRLLQALEQDKFNQLPGGIFNKGFVRAYARFVGLDEDQTIADYLDASGEAPPARPEANNRESDHSGSRETPARPLKTRGSSGRETKPRNIRIQETEDAAGPLELRAAAASRQLPWGIFAAVLLFVALALSLWSHFRRTQHPESHPPAAASSVSPSSEVRPGEQPSAPSSGISTASQSATAAIQTKPSTPAVGDTSAKPAPLPTTSQTPPIATSSPAPAPGTFTLLIKAREDSWITLTVDGKPEGSDMLLGGGERTVFAHKSVVVKAGNAGAVDFLLNGKKLPPVGGFGEVKIVTIGPTGIQPITSAAPPTP